MDQNTCSEIGAALMPVRRVDKVGDARARPAGQTKGVHLSRARSIPWRAFDPHSVLAHRRLDHDAPLFIISGEKVVGSLAAGRMAAAGLTKAIVLEGRMKAWEERGLPVIRKGCWRLSARSLRAAVAPVFMLAAVGLLFGRFIFFPGARAPGGPVSSGGV